MKVFKHMLKSKALRQSPSRTLLLTGIARVLYLPVIIRVFKLVYSVRTFTRTLNVSYCFVAIDAIYLLLIVWQLGLSE